MPATPARAAQYWLRKSGGAITNHNPMATKAAATASIAASFMRLSGISIGSLWSSIGDAFIAYGAPDLHGMTSRHWSPFRSELSRCANAMTPRERRRGRRSAQILFLPFPRTCLKGVRPREFRAEEQDLRGVIHPQEEHDQCAGCAVGGLGGFLAQVQAERELADAEQHGGDDRAKPDVVPRDPGVGHIAEDQRKQGRDHRSGDDELHDMPQCLAAG